MFELIPPLLIIQFNWKFACICIYRSYTYSLISQSINLLFMWSQINQTCGKRHRARYIDDDITSISLKIPSTDLDKSRSKVCFFSLHHSSSFHFFYKIFETLVWLLMDFAHTGFTIVEKWTKLKSKVYIIYEYKRDEMVLRKTPHWRHQWYGQMLV